MYRSRPQSWAAFFALLPYCTALATNFSSTSFAGSIDAGSGVLQSLRPASQPDFDFLPSDYYSLRNDTGNYHTGDVTIRFRTVDNGTWLSADSAQSRQRPIVKSSSSEVLQQSSLDQTLSTTSDYLSINRTWTNVQGDVVLSFDITNIRDTAVELGSLGLPIEINNIFTNRTPEEVTARCSLADPSIGLNAGYVQVTRLTGTGPNLVITPFNNETKLEAWHFLSEPYGPSQYMSNTYEGNYEWLIYSKAFAETEWQEPKPWNEPTSKVLQPGEKLTVGLRFSLAQDLEHIESVVAAQNIPVAVGIPGYVVSQDVPARLFINSTKNISAIETNPKSALEVNQGDRINPWYNLTVSASPSSFGRVRIQITFEDQTTQTLHYWVSKSGHQLVSDVGNFLTTTQHYVNDSDAFGRSPSILTYDRWRNQFVTQDNRTWVAGLSDEGGAGSFVAAALKQSVQPSAREVSVLEDFVHQTVRGGLQVSNGSDRYGVHKSLFFYEPSLKPGFRYDPTLDWSSWSSWDYEAAYILDRSYDYVWVSALYWSLYKASTLQPGILSQANSTWYLKQSYETVKYCFATTAQGNTTGYRDLGLMGETVWLQLLQDLRKNKFVAEANDLEATMRTRQAVWSARAEPFGSEQPWDSTGQEGVYLWSLYFNDSSTQQKTIDSIRGYMPTLSHWGYNGNARRYWDFTTAGDPRIASIERQIHHYGSGLNSLPLLTAYRRSLDPQSPTNFYNLRVGYGGHQGPMTNVDKEGFGSMAFHSYADRLFWDPYSGDYGPNFLGHVFGAATWLVEHATFGWLAFGGNIVASGEHVTVEVKDSVRKSIFVAPLRFGVSIEGPGMFDKFAYSPVLQSLNVTLAGSVARGTILRFDGVASTSNFSVKGATKLSNSYLVDANRTNLYISL